MFIIDWIMSRLSTKRLGISFIDKVSGETVYEYMDRGRIFLANYNHWWFRVYLDEEGL